MAVQPIRLFGDPVLRTTRRCRSRRSTRSCAGWSRTSPTPCSTRPGSGLRRRRSASALRVFTYDVDDEIGHLINPVLGPFSEEMMDGEEGCLSLARAVVRAQAPGARRRRRAEHVRRAGGRSRAPATCRARSSTRPTTSTASSSSTGSTRRQRKQAEGGDPRGRVVRRAAHPTSRLSPHPLFGRAL